MLGCAKHYVGDGGTTWGTGTAKWEVPGKPFALDQGDTRLTEAELRRIHMLGYPAAIEAGVGTIMPSYNSWNGEKASGSKRLLTDILKGELGFEGFLISDYNALDQLPGDFRSDIKTSINAGMDMVMVPEKYKEFHALLKDLAEKGEVPMARIDDAVKRILRVKAAMGLLDGEPRGARGSRAREELRLAPSIAPWRGARCASRWSCSRTTRRRCPWPRARRASTSRARAPTTSGTRWAAGPSPGRARAAPPRPAAPPSWPRSRTRPRRRRA